MCLESSFSSAPALTCPLTRWKLYCCLCKTDHLDSLFHIETLSFPCTKTVIYGAVNGDRNDDRDVDFYEEFGGDGDRDAYLGDGISIRPDGTYYDDR